MQVLQLLGASLILAAFALVQTGRLAPYRYLTICLNLSGALLLGVTAYAGDQYGFLLLNICWSAVAAWGLFRRILVTMEESNK